MLLKKSFNLKEPADIFILENESIMVDSIGMLMIFLSHDLIIKILTIFFKFLNNLHPNIRFKYEFEMNGSLPFLDLKIHRYDNWLLYFVYRKEINSLSYINFLSAHHNDIKKSVISGQFLRFNLYTKCFRIWFIWIYLYINVIQLLRVSFMEIGIEFNLIRTLFML